MEDVFATPFNGLKVVSTFTGAGGSCLGFRSAGYQTIWANEFVRAARETYKANFSDVTMDGRDIRKIQPSEILDAIGMKPGDVDVLEGSPPCASFSLMGIRQEAWGQTKKYSDTEQRVDDLFFEFARILRGIQPRVFVSENVKGLNVGRAKGYYLEIKKALEDAGYSVGAKVLDAQWLGVPQHRERLIFIGVRKDLNRAPVFPRPLPYRYSIRDALPTVQSFTIKDIFGDPAKRIPSWCTAPTVDTVGMGAKVYHKLDVRDWESREPRRLTIEELRLLCGLPADFVLTGKFAQQWERCGRAVPPPMMKAVASTLASEVFGV